MTLQENKLKQILDYAKKRDFYNALYSLRLCMHIISPSRYADAYSYVLREMVCALSAKGAYLTPRTYQLFMDLPLINYDDSRISFMERTNKMYKVILKRQQNEFNSKKIAEKELF